MSKPAKIAEPRERSHGIARRTQVRLFLTLWLIYLIHWSPFVVRELYLAISIAERGTVRVDPYVELHSDLFTIPGRGSFLGNNPGAAFLAAVPYWIALPVIDRVAPVRPVPPEELGGLGENYHDERVNRLRFFRKAKEMGILLRLAVGALVTSGFFMAPLAALSAVVFLRLLGRMGFAPGAALWMALLYGIGTPIFLRAGTLSLNLMVAVFTLFSFALLWRKEAEEPPVSREGTRSPESPGGDDRTLRFRPGQVPGGIAAAAAAEEASGKKSFDEEETAEIRVPPKPRPDREWLRYFFAGLLAGWALLSDYTGIITLGMLGLFALWQQTRKKGFGAAVKIVSWFVAGALGPLLLLLYYQWACFGSPWWPAQFYMPQQVFAGYPGERGVGWPLPAALWGLLFDPQYGVLVFAPVFALALYHPILVWRRRNRVPGRVALFAWLFFAALYLFCSMIHYTVRHQWQDGVRYMVPALPLLMLLVADVLSRARRGVVLLVTVLAVGEAWATAMVRESPYQSLHKVLTAGPQFPWLTTLQKAAVDFFPPLADANSPLAQWLPWAVVGALLLGVWLTWRIGPREEFGAET